MLYYAFPLRPCRFIMLGMTELARCNWCLGDDLMVEYHDKEWGVPVHNDKKLFEYMVLDAFQAGLSWRTVLHKRKAFREAFDNFNPIIISNYNEAKIAELMANPQIIRNRAKILSTVSNAKAFLEVQRKYGTFGRFIWEFVCGKPIITNLRDLKEIKSHSPESDFMSVELKKLGFKFVGTTICYAFMQAAGLVNDHEINCFRFQQLKSRVKGKTA